MAKKSNVSDQKTTSRSQDALLWWKTKPWSEATDTPPPGGNLRWLLIPPGPDEAKRILRDTLAFAETIIEYVEEWLAVCAPEVPRPPDLPETLVHRIAIESLGLLLRARRARAAVVAAARTLATGKGDAEATWADLVVCAEALEKAWDASIFREYARSQQAKGEAHSATQATRAALPRRQRGILCAVRQIVGDRGPDAKPAEVLRELKDRCMADRDYEWDAPHGGSDSSLTEAAAFYVLLDDEGRVHQQRVSDGKVWRALTDKTLLNAYIGPELKKLRDPTVCPVYVEPLPNPASWADAGSSTEARALWKQRQAEAGAPVPERKKTPIARLSG